MAIAAISARGEGYGVVVGFGVLLAVVGLIFIIWPGPTVTLLMILVGLSALLFGISAIVQALAMRRALQGLNVESAAPEDGRRPPSDMVGRMVASSRFFVLLATVSLFLAFMAVMVSTMIVTVTTVWQAAVYRGHEPEQMIGKLIKQADYALLATVLYVLALGLYSLFVDDRVPMPLWLRIHDLGQLKELLAGVVVVAIAVIFLGQALTWDGTSDLLAPGLASAAVIAALALFLWQAARERHMESESGDVVGKGAGTATAGERRDEGEESGRRA